MEVKELLGRYAAGEQDFRGAQLSRSRRERANNVGPDLNGANLAGANFRAANLAGVRLSRANLVAAIFIATDLRGADLGHAVLCGANLTEANLSGANLRDADLTGANLFEANLARANLTNANLAHAHIIGTNLSDALLTGANCDGCHLGDATLSQVDLGSLVHGRGIHVSPSAVDWRSVLASVQLPGLKDFLRATGMPDVFAEYMVDCARSLKPEMVFTLLQSTFISYGGPDEAFAQKLNEALEERGVTTFFFKDDAPPGERLHRVMRKGVNDHDRTILICSAASLVRPGLLNELQETLAREARDGGRTYLIPVRLDNYVIEGWAQTNPDLAQTVGDRVIADFRNHKDEATFEAEVAKLIAVLKRPLVSPSPR